MNKYSAEKCSRDIGKELYKFDSKAEARHFDSLIIQLKNGGISDLVLQPEFEIAPSFELRCNFTKNKITKIGKMVYTPDFKYKKNGKTVVDEVKGMVTAAYRIRLKMFLSDASLVHGVDQFNEIIKGDTKTYHLNNGG